MQQTKNTSLETDLIPNFESEFAQDVFEGLSSSPKWISSKYFYDETGDAIFQEIMEMDSYYLTRAEMAIFQNEKESFRKDIFDGRYVSFYELGAGDGQKTKVLLEHFANHSEAFDYNPIDISGNVLNILQERLLSFIPSLDIHLLQGDYFEKLADISKSEKDRNVVMFLGSNIGNFSNPNALKFLEKLKSKMSPGDLLLIGFDLKKEPETILEAYGDKEGVTARFNLNLLHRMNEELGANFKMEEFRHHPIYDPMTGECRSYLLSQSDQEINVDKLGMSFHFRKWEPLFTEVSKKYDLSEINRLAEKSGFTPYKTYTDPQGLFVDVMWQLN